MIKVVVWGVGAFTPGAGTGVIPGAVWYGAPEPGPAEKILTGYRFYFEKRDPVSKINSGIDFFLKIGDRFYFVNRDPFFLRKPDPDLSLRQ